MTLKTMTIGRFKHAKTRYFFAFCVVGEISLVVHGGDANLE